jgi:crotonobetainyl-CoA:carnitine CoA-transferase CaiB-like acyl-CoA transferase
MHSPEMQSPFAGLRVLELARILAGPWIGQTLADLGADVIKVEAPEGDDTRRWGPPFVHAPSGESLDSAYFHSIQFSDAQLSLGRPAPRLGEHTQEILEELAASQSDSA